jgi:LysW-gamma-L-alpha-aminoadipyl-6-phosphate/LysW-L-glutamyl-5-phosphate reductase
VREHVSGSFRAPGPGRGGSGGPRTLPSRTGPQKSTWPEWYESLYASAPAVRLWPGVLPELRYSVHTPFCDLGWSVREGHLVIGFALDNLLKGAASQAVQNLNLLLGLPEMLGLAPAAPVESVHR